MSRRGAYNFLRPNVSVPASGSRAAPPAGTP